MEAIKGGKKNGVPAEFEGAVTKASRETLTKAMQEEREERAKACGKELEAILKKYDCGIVGAPVFDAEGRVRVQITIAAR